MPSFLAIAMMTTTSATATAIVPHGKDRFKPTLTTLLALLALLGLLGLLGLLFDTFAI